MRRALAHPRSLVAGLGVAWIVLTGAGSNPDKGKYWVAVRQRLRPHPGRRPEGRRRARGQDHRHQARQAHQARARSASRSTRTASARCARDAFCESRPQSLIGEYFVDCLPGTAKQELKPGAVIPVTPHGVDRRARPRQRHPAPPLPRAPEPHHRLAGRRRGGQRREPQRRHPPRQPGPARDRQGARHAGRAEQDPRRPDRQRRQGRRRPRRQPQGRRALRQRGQGHRAGLGRAPRRHRGRPARAAGLPRAAAADDEGARPGGRRPGLGAAQPRRLVQAAHDLLRPARPVRRRLAAGLQVAGPARRRPAIAPSRRRRPSIVAARRLRRRHARARQEPLDRPAAPRRPQVRRREGPAQPRRPGLHRPRGAAAVRLRPDDLDVDLRPEQPHPQDRRLRRAVRRLRQRGDAQEEPGPRDASAARASGPIQPGLNYPDVTKRAARGRQGSRGAAKRADGDHDLPLPAVPAPRRHARARGARRPRPTPSTPSLPSVPTPSTPDGADADRPRRAARRPAAAARRRRHRQQRSRRRPAPLPPLPKLGAKTSSDPQAQTKLLDYLLKP